MYKSIALNKVWYLKNRVINTLLHKKIYRLYKFIWTKYNVNKKERLCLLVAKLYTQNNLVGKKFHFQSFTKHGNLMSIEVKHSVVVISTFMPMKYIKKWHTDKIYLYRNSGPI